MRRPEAASNTTVSATSPIVADNATSSTITVTLMDANSNVVSGKTVTLAQGAGNVEDNKGAEPMTAPTTLVVFWPGQVAGSAAEPTKHAPTAA